MGCQFFRFGALYLGGNAKRVPQICHSGGDTPHYDSKSAISFGEAVDGEPIMWVKPSGMNLLIADRVLLVNVSWSDLHKNGYIGGKEIIIAGCRFRCRLLRVGASKDEPNEWDQAVKIAGDGNNFWHEEGMYFWGAEVAHQSHVDCVVRGFTSTQNRKAMAFGTVNSNVGFRPALEPLGTENPFLNCKLDGVDFQLGSFPGTAGLCPILQATQGNIFTDIPEGRGVRMYTFLENGHPINPYGTFCDKSRLSLTDKYFGDKYLIPWVISNGIAIGHSTLRKNQ